MKKILVVDDDIDILFLVKATLTRYNFQVETISHWEEIEQVIKRFNPDFILLDISLGGADGRDICSGLTRSSATSHIPVILFSANNEMGSAYQQYGAKAFIGKPYELKDLLQALNN